MKIVYVTNTIHRGGAEEYLIRLCENLIIKNSIYVIIPHIDGTNGIISELKEIGIECIDLKLYNQNIFSKFKAIFNRSLSKAHSIENNDSQSVKDKLLVKIKYLFDYISSFIIEKEIKKINPDIVHFNLHDVKRQYPSISKISKKFKCIVTLHLVPPNFSLLNEKEQKKDLLKSIQNKTKYFAVSNTNAKLFSNAIEFKIDYIYNGIKINNLINFKKEDRDIFIKKYKIPQDNTIFATVGRIDYTQKDYITIIKAMSKLKETSNNITLVIVGDGGHMDRLKKDIKKYKLENNIVLTGYIRDVNLIYKSIDCLIFSTKYEGFPLVLLEAMSYHSNIIASDIDTTKELIKDQYNGLLFKAGKYEDLLRVLKNNLIILKSKQFKDEINDTLINFSEEKMINRIINEYKK